MSDYKKGAGDWLKAFIFHCWGGGPRDCWRGWLADRLQKLGIGVIAPEFPDSANPNCEGWVAEARRMVPRFDEEWVLVSHSLGGPTILRLLEKFRQGERVRGVVMVAGFSCDLGIPQIADFVDHEFDWQKIREGSRKFVLINSDNDPFIPLGEGKRLARLLDAELIVEHEAGHINEGAGFVHYPRVLEEVRKLFAYDYK